MTPITARDWKVLAVGAVLATGAFWAVTERFEVQRGVGLSYIRLDHWTGSVQRCGATCAPVTDAAALPPGPAKGAANPFD